MSLVEGGEPGQGLVEFDEIKAVLPARKWCHLLVKGDRPLAASALLSPDPLGVVPENLAHGLRCDGKEVGPVFGPAEPPSELDPGLVDQGGRLKGVAPGLGAEEDLGELFELVVDQGGQGGGGGRVSVSDLAEEAGNVVWPWVGHPHQFKGFGGDQLSFFHFFRCSCRETSCGGTVSRREHSQRLARRRISPPDPGDSKKQVRKRVRRKPGGRRALKFAAKASEGREIDMRWNKGRWNGSFLEVFTGRSWRPVVCFLVGFLGIAWGALPARASSTIAVGDGPIAVAINPVTNKTYVANEVSDTVTVIDGRDNSTQTVAAGADPSAVAVNPVTNKIYVANAGGSGTMTVIDGSDNSTQTVPVGILPYRVAVNPVTNKIYVANLAGGDVTVIDGSDNSTQTVFVGGLPNSLAVNPVTNKIYVSSGNTVTVIDGTDNSTQAVAVPSPWGIAVNQVTNRIYVGSDNSLTVIDGSDNSTQTVAVGDGRAAVSVNLVTNKIYVANEDSASVTVIDGSDNSTETVSVGAVPFAVAVNPFNDKIYVVNRDSDTVTVIDGSDNSTRTVDVEGTPFAVAMNPVTNKICVANRGSDSVTVIDGSDNSIQTGPLGDITSAVTVNPVTNKIYVVNWLNDSVTVIDGVDNSTQTVAVGDEPLAAVVNPVTNKIYVANHVSDDVTVIDGIDNSTQTVAAGARPLEVALNPVTNKIYVLNAGTQDVTVIDGIDHSTQTVVVGGFPIAIAVNPVTNKIYVAKELAGVMVIDGTDNSTVAFGDETFAIDIAVNPVTNKIYVVHEVAGKVTVIDGVDNSIQTVAVGSSPVAIAVNPITNKIYVANSVSPTLTVIDGSDNSTETVASSFPVALAVNPVTNMVYVMNSSPENLTVIDGSDNSTNSTWTFAVGGNWKAMAVNPVTNKIYLSNGVFQDPLTVIDEQIEQDIPLDVTITPLPNNVSVTRCPEFMFEASSTYSPGMPAISRIYYQIDTWTGEWKEATPAGSTASATTEQLTQGYHVIYAFATDGQEASMSAGASPVLGEIAAYPFTVIDCVQGNVNDGGGVPQGVLKVNGGTGGAARTVSVNTNETFSIALDASASGPVASVRYVFWTWAGDFSNASGALLPFNGRRVGRFVNPTPLHPGQSPQPLFCIRSDSMPDDVCVMTDERPGPSFAPFSFTRNGGFANPIKLMFQGLLQDFGGSGPVNFSVTNAVVLSVE